MICWGCWLRISCSKQGFWLWGSQLLQCFNKWERHRAAWVAVLLVVDWRRQQFEREMRGGGWGLSLLRKVDLELLCIPTCVCYIWQWFISQTFWDGISFVKIHKSALRKGICLPHSVFSPLGSHPSWTFGYCLFIVEEACLKIGDCN